MTIINVLNDGTKVYGVVLKGVSREKTTRKGGRHKEHKYPFLTMAVDECFLVANKEDAGKAQRAGNKAPYNVSTSTRPVKVDGKATGEYYVFLNGPKGSREAEIMVGA